MLQSQRFEEQNRDGRYSHQKEEDDKLSQEGLRNVSKRLYGRAIKREDEKPSDVDEKIPMDTIRQQVLKERDQELLNQLE